MIIIITIFRLYQDLSKRPVANLMHNITINLDILTGCVETKLSSIHPTTALLRSFSGSTVPRARCTIAILFTNDAGFLLDASFLDTLGKLTGFQIMDLKMAFVNDDLDGIYEVSLPTYETLSGYLEGKLGAGDGGGFDGDGYYRLRYHPRGRGMCEPATLV